MKNIMKKNRIYKYEENNLLLIFLYLTKLKDNTTEYQHIAYLLHTSENDTEHPFRFINGQFLKFKTYSNLHMFSEEVK